MRKLLMAVVCLAMLSACNKSSSSSTAAATSKWKVGSIEYTTLYSFRAAPSSGDPMLTGWDKTGPDGAANPSAINSWAVSFKTMPTASGNYKIVAYPSSGTLANTTDAYVTAKSGSSIYVSSGAGAVVNATVTVTSGKITVVVPDIPMMGTSGGATTTFSGTLIEM